MNRAERAIAEALDSYLEGLVDSEQLRGRHPQHVEELEGCIAVIEKLRAARPADPDPANLQLRRREFEMQVEQFAAARERSGVLQRLRGWVESLFMQTRVAAAAFALVVVVLAGSGVSAAALVAPPDSLLYGYRLTVERAAIQLADEKDRATLNLEFAERRISELNSLGPGASPRLVARVAGSYQDGIIDGLESINSQRDEEDFNLDEALDNFLQRVQMHREQLDLFEIEVEPVDLTLGRFNLSAPSPLGVGSVPSSDRSSPELAATKSPTPVPTAAPTVAPNPEPTPEPTPTPEPEPEAVEVSGTITDIGRGALRLGETTVLLEADGHPAAEIDGQPEVGAAATVTGVRSDDSTIIAQTVRITPATTSPTAQPTPAPTPTPTTVDPGSSIADPTPTPTPTPTPIPIVAVAPFEYSGYVEAYDGDTLTINGSVVFISGDGQPAASVSGAELGVGALIEVEGELLSDLRLRARTISVKVGAL